MYPINRAIGGKITKRSGINLLAMLVNAFFFVLMLQLN